MAAIRGARIEIRYLPAPQRGCRCDLVRLGTLVRPVHTKPAQSKQSRLSTTNHRSFAVELARQRLAAPGLSARTRQRNELRIGYIYNPNPIPDNTLTPFLQAFMEQGVTAVSRHPTLWVGMSTSVMCMNGDRRSTKVPVRYSAAISATAISVPQ